MSAQRIRLRSIILLAVFLADLALTAATTSSPHNQASVDDALLLWIASERVLALSEVEQGRRGGALARPPTGGDPGADAMELESLIQTYRELYAQYADQLRQQGYAPDDPIFAQLRAELAAKTEGLERRKAALLRARRRLQNPTWVRRAARLVGKILGGGVTVTGKVVNFTMEKAVPGAIRLAPEVAKQVLQERVRREREKLTERAWRLVSRRLGGDVTLVLREVVYPLFRRKQERRRRRRVALRQTQTAQALARLATPSSDEAQGLSRLRVEITEDDLAEDESYIAWFNYDYTSPTSITTTVDTLSLWLEFDFENGTLRGEFEATGDCSDQCDYPEEWMESHVRGRIVDGWVRPSGDGGWEWGGTVENEIAVAGLNVLGMVVPADGPPFAQTDEVSQSGAVPARIEGSTSPTCKFGQPGGSPPCFEMGGPWDTPPNRYLAWWLICEAPDCGLPEVWPAPE